MLVEIAASRCPPESGLPLKAVVASTSTTPSRKARESPSVHSSCSWAWSVGSIVAPREQPVQHSL
jgi:hypothetical protein